MLSWSDDASYLSPSHHCRQLNNNAKTLPTLWLVGVCQKAYCGMITSFEQYQIARVLRGQNTVRFYFSQKLHTRRGAWIIHRNFSSRLFLLFTSAICVSLVLLLLYFRKYANTFFREFLFAFFLVCAFASRCRSSLVSVSRNVGNDSPIDKLTSK